MAGVLVDAGFLIALLSRRDRHHSWAAAQRLCPKPFTSSGRGAGLRWPRCYAAARWFPPSTLPTSRAGSWI